MKKLSVLTHQCIFSPRNIVFPALIFFIAAFQIFVSGQETDDNLSPSAVRFSENFDGVSAPQIPAGWTTSVTGSGAPFVSVTNNSQTMPNAVFTTSPSTVSSAELTSPPITLGNRAGVLTFRHAYNTELNWDGGVLEIKIGNGSFQDIIAAGGEFTSHGYSTTPLNASQNPLSGRRTWTGNTGIVGGLPMFVTTTVNLPPSTLNQVIQLRWRHGSDQEIGTPTGGWWIDSVTLEEGNTTFISYAVNFDAVAAPQLPANWTTATTGSGTPFVTQTQFAQTAPNAIFTTDPATVGSSEIVSPTIRVGGSQNRSSRLIFQNYYNTEASNSITSLGYDGGVLEISINGGAFQDIIAAGGNFLRGGYNRTLSNQDQNPLGGRMAWSGDSGGFIKTEIELPPSAARQMVRFKWIHGSDRINGRPGWYIDGVQIIDSITGENASAISIPANGIASPYPSGIQVTDLDGQVSSVSVNLENFSHTSPDDVDLMLVAPNGRRVILMSDVGGANPVSNLSLNFDESATAALPDNSVLTSGSYKPTNFELDDIFPAPAPNDTPIGRTLGFFNGSAPNGDWKLFLVDDNGNNAGTISGGWSIIIQTSNDLIGIPTSGIASVYPSEKTISGQIGAITKVTVNLSNFSHTSPDDVDVLLVAPNGRRIVLMSDVGGNNEVGGINLTFDDVLGNSLPDDAPLVSGVYRPANFEPDDNFPAPAPSGAPGGTTLGHFYGSQANGIWRLFIVDDAGENSGTISGNWSLDIQSSPNACTFTLLPPVQTASTSGGANSFNVNMPAGCPWNAVSSSGFVTITSGTDGEGFGTVSYSVTPNTGPLRTGRITVSGANTQVFQVQQVSGCPATLTASAQNFPASGGAGSIAVTAGANCGYQGETNVPWIQITSPPASGNGTVAFTVSPNNNPNPRSAAITVASQSVNIFQAGTRKRRFDFDGDGKTDISVFRPANGSWYILQSQNNSFTSARFGLADDIITPADYDGDGKTDFAVFRGGIWYLLRSSQGFSAVTFGQTGDVPVPADYDGDGKDDIAVYRPGAVSYFYYIGSANNPSGNLTAVGFGTNGDIPVAADYDGDGKTDVAVFRPSNGTWYVSGSADGFFAAHFGTNGDKPVPADYDGDGRADFAVIRQGIWYLQQTTAGFSATAFGFADDRPTVGDYDGDGRADIAVFRPSNGTWYILSTTAGFSAHQFGQNGDVPIPSAFIR